MVRGQTHAPLSRVVVVVVVALPFTLSTSSEKCSSQLALSLLKQMAAVEKFMSQSKTPLPSPLP